MNEQTREKAHSRYRIVATATARIHPVSGVCRTIPAWCKVAAGHPRDAWAECDQKRRFKPSAEANVCQGMDEPLKPFCGRSGATGAWFADSVSPRFAEGLQPVCLYVIPARLRSGKDRNQALGISNDRLDDGRQPRERTNSGSAGNVATRPKIKNAIPATGQSPRSSSRHGTKSPEKGVEIADFVPPRYKTPHFSGFHCPATGHLYRYAISRGNLWA
jgi:hypothetical protein